MSYDMRAKLVPYSSVTGQSIPLTDPTDGRVVAQVNVMAPA
jgi:hypothetical protein